VSSTDVREKTMAVYLVIKLAGKRLITTEKWRTNLPLDHLPPSKCGQPDAYHATALGHRCQPGCRLDPKTLDYPHIDAKMRVSLTSNAFYADKANGYAV